MIGTPYTAIPLICMVASQKFWPYQFVNHRQHAFMLQCSSDEQFYSLHSLFYRSQKWNKQYSCVMFQFHKHCHYCSCLLCSVVHTWSTGWCCGTLLYCEEEHLIWLPEVLLSDNSSQAAATASTSVWWRERSNFSSENNLPTFWLNAPVVTRVKVKKCEQTLLFIAALMTTRAFSQNTASYFPS